MSTVLRRPFGNHGKVHEITPQSAGWRYVGFSLYRLRAGEVAAEAANSFPRQALHAATLGFIHPVTGEELQFEAPLPPDMRALTEMLRAVE